MTILQHLLATVEGDWQLLEEVMELYFTDAPQQLQRIRHAIERNDPLEVREAAHSLKGATGAFGKDNEVFQLAFTLEQTGQSGQLDQAMERYQQLETALKQMEQSLRHTIAKHMEGKR
ncbi:MAG: Hpt domain-containing protein [Magnetococcales bacterium]|nr:Hpt domain-containing protein [Magnetococcales bacterium]MBF0150856.1 Hpt domain-containing protein [Magnetococcales bacterium]MBF0173851.1 Hpt domain-containing protein [Magnetococcales bacterium]MBF0347011.1 Hpt domain-containing protein [Magnetococcales bacterium]MBF0631331.1 Hpt domain-containing protein [Magnetococcales bacterium]